jgi:hydroxyacylglutathione hydrolase
LRFCTSKMSFIMTNVVQLTFNPFSENTYLVYDDTGECAIFDPGCLFGEEKEELIGTIERLRLKPVLLINTHCHLDHVFGNALVANTYQLELAAHQGEIPVLEMAPIAANRWGVPFPDPSPPITRFIEDKELIHFGETTLEARFTPGHSPASLCFYCEKDAFVIGGDVLFKDSIGRYDLPGGNLQTLLASIKRELMNLPDEVKVYSGHGPATTVGRERVHNPFLQG